MATDEVLVVVEIEAVIDGEELQAYQAAARQQLKERGGKVLGRGGTTFEGDRRHGPLLVQVWPSEAAFREWQASDAYRPLLDRRRRAAKLRIAIVPTA